MRMQTETMTELELILTTQLITAEGDDMTPSDDDAMKDDDSTDVDAADMDDDDDDKADEVAE